MATNKNFEVKNGLSVGGTERISSAGAFTGSLASTTTATTQSATDNSTKIATTAYTDAAITAVIGGAPGTLDTLNELAAAINDDASYASTLTTALATKLPLAGGTMTGTLNAVAANFSSNVRVSGWLTGASATNTLFSGNAQGTIIQTPSNTNDAAGSFYIRDSLGNVHFTLNTNTNVVDIAGTINSGAITSSASITASGNITAGNNGNINIPTASSGNANISFDGSDFNITSNSSIADMNFQTSSQTRMTLGVGGDLTTYPLAGQNVVFNENGVDADFRVESNNNSHMLFVDASANIVAFGQTQNISGGGMYFNDSNTTRSHLVVSNTETSFAESLYYGNRQNSDGQVFQFRRQNSTVGNVYVNSIGATYNTTSDRRLKDNIETIIDGTDKLMAMNPVTHGWKADPEADTVHGFIAQDMLAIVPEAVSGDPEGEEMMSMDYGRITPVIVAALQEANKKIMELENRINELEAK